MAELDKPQRRPSRRIRCAIYTRKSTDEGLDQAFNSLDAQREACAAYVLSQKHEGWTVSPKLYDDGGFSGGNTERPALKKLLADIESDEIDTVVVYKVDRLTRALSDFAKLVEVFDRRGVSFVSITQQFNTTTSMGRLTLNVLLSFAQFEREVIGERVRDKIAASKKKGMWMGGWPSLGYDVKDRKLVVNEEEARTVADIFRRYLQVKSVHALKEELDLAAIRSKRRIRPDGAAYGGQKLSRGALYLMLKNPIYRGEVTHKGKSYPGEHPAIIERSLWDEVQGVLSENRVERTTGKSAKHPSLLAGLLFDQAGERLTPTHAVKKGKRYRYYVSIALLTGQKRTGGRRIPAGDLEAAVIERLRSFLADSAAVIDVIDDETNDHAQLVQRAGQVAEALRASPTETKTLLTALLRRVVIQPDRIELVVSRNCLVASLAGRTIDSTSQEPKTDRDDVFTLTAPARLQRVGQEMRMLVPNANDKAVIDPRLLRIVARAHGIRERLMDNPELTVHDIARCERVSPAYIYALLRLPYLAPDITTAIIEGRQPPNFNAMKLMRATARLPSDWAEQRTLLGFR